MDEPWRGSDDPIELTINPDSIPNQAFFFENEPVIEQLLERAADLTIRELFKLLPSPLSASQRRRALDCLLTKIKTISPYKDSSVDSDEVLMAVEILNRYSSSLDPQGLMNAECEKARLIEELYQKKIGLDTCQLFHLYKWLLPPTTITERCKNVIELLYKRHTALQQGYRKTLMLATSCRFGLIYSPNLEEATSQQIELEVENSNTPNVGVICDGCETVDFVGYRYSCQQCKVLDLCGPCQRLISLREPTTNSAPSKMNLEGFKSKYPNHRPESHVMTRISSSPIYVFGTDQQQPNQLRTESSYSLDLHFYSHGKVEYSGMKILGMFHVTLLSFEMVLGHLNDKQVEYSIELRSIEEGSLPAVPLGTLSQLNPVLRFPYPYPIIGAVPSVRIIAQKLNGRGSRAMGNRNVTMENPYAHRSTMTTGQPRGQNNITSHSRFEVVVYADQLPFRLQNLTEQTTVGEIKRLSAVHFGFDASMCELLDLSNQPLNINLPAVRLLSNPQNRVISLRLVNTS